MTEKGDREGALTLTRCTDSVGISFLVSIRNCDNASLQYVSLHRGKAAAGGVGGLIVCLYDQCEAAG